MRATHNGRPGYPPAPADWGARLAPAVERWMTAECEIRAKSGMGIADPDSGIRSVSPGALWYAGRCRVQRRNRTADQVASGEQEITEATYLVSIPIGITAAIRGGQVTFTETDDDPTLLAVRLEVVEVVKGTMRFQRDLWCSLQL